MLASFKRFALVLLIAILPLQGFAAIVTPLCQQEPAASAIDAAHSHPGGANTPDHHHAPSAGNSSSDHCGTASAFAIPVKSTSLVPAATAERNWFAAAYRSGFIPEQPQRPPLA